MLKIPCYGEFLRKTLLPTIWISVSEFARNELLLKLHWTGHYEKMGLVFPSEPINGAMWGVWSLLLAIAIFVLMWVVIGNMAVLPYGILVYAIPLSLVECFVAGWIIQKTG